MYVNEDTATTEKSSAFLNTLSNGLCAVEVLAQGGRTLLELAEALQLPRQTTYRILHTLEVSGWVKRRESDNTYGLTTALWGIGVRSHEATDLRRTWADTVALIGNQFGETVHLAVYDRGFSVYIDKRDGWQPIGSYTKLGGRSPAHCVATGKVLLASQPDDEISRVINEGPTSFTPNTIIDPGAVRRNLDQIRRSRYAINQGEYRAEVGGIAVPIYSPLGDVIAAVGFSGPIERINSNQDRLLEALTTIQRNEETPNFS